MITLAAFFIFLCLGLPIVFLLLMAAIVFAWSNDASILFDSFLVQSVKGVEANGFLAIPLYMLVGEIMNRGGITERLIRSSMRLVGRMRGGLAFVNVLTNAFAAAILGSATAQIAIMSRSIVPEMERQGYKRPFATGLTVATGLLGPIIPPSMLMIIYGVLAYQSVAALFIAGLIPGLLLMSAFFVTVWLSKSHLPEVDESRLPGGALREVVADALPGLIPLTIISGVVSGAMTPTEAGALAAVVAFVLAAFVYRRLGIEDFVPTMKSVVLSSASIIMLIGFATLLGWTLAYEAVPDMLAQGIASVAIGPVSFLVLVCVAVFVLGMFLDGIGVLIVTVPVLLPIATQFGVDPVHFGVVLAISTLTGLVSPPVGPGLYIAMEATGLKMMEVFRGALPFLGAFVLVLIIVILLPALSVWLPAAVGL
ncbi:TRAP transporter, DctM subunit [Celeribacter baekdonensis]|uniref:TRAP transporter large permease protein n=1 Tax=Celeribacter baekdonensis TaxID=875171 RepID=A0A1G7QYK4_9RHOB|nr:TRAP transporter large permease [Celeribacter baekdonensis]SDG03524.1 TRAP transporter, DctM subunit [Celeribacter baekdonensis]